MKEDNKLSPHESEDKSDKLDKVSLQDVMNESSSTAMVPVKDYFAFLRTDLSQYGDMELSSEVAERLKARLKTFRSGIKASVPLICPGGQKCPIVHNCPFAEWKSDGTLDPKSKFPILQTCPIEGSFFKFRIQSYIEEYEIHADSPSTIALLNKLAELDTYDMRCDVILSVGDRGGEGTDMMKEEVSSIHQPSGDVYYTLKVHPVWEIKEKIHKQRMDILDVLIGTPKAQLKAKTGVLSTLTDGDLALQMSKLRTRLDNINKAIEIQGSVNVDFIPPEE